MEHFLIYLLLGACAGVLAGLFGVGGGLVIVPVLVYLFMAQGFDPNVLVHMAIGTSLATIVFTSLSSVRAHHKRGAVHWGLVYRLSPGILLGALIGAVIADVMPAIVLRRSFAFFEWLVGIQLLLNLQSKFSGKLPGTFGLFIVGKFIGVISSIIGIGGGTLSVPFLTWCKLSMREAVATSSALGLPIAMAGTLGFVITGMQTPIQADWNLGYFYLPAFSGIVLASIVFAPLGARLAHYLPSSLLKQLFGLFLIGLGSYMFIA